MRFVIRWTRFEGVAFPTRISEGESFKRARTTASAKICRSYVSHIKRYGISSWQCGATRFVSTSLDCAVDKFSLEVEVD